MSQVSQSINQSINLRNASLTKFSKQGIPCSRTFKYLFNDFSRTILWQLCAFRKILQYTAVYMQQLFYTATDSLSNQGQT